MLDFKGTLAEIQQLHDTKSKDYGVDADPFANVRASEDFGIPAWLGTIVRLNDKITRIKSFARNGSLANESLRDSLIDIAVYGAIAVTLYDQQQQITPEFVKQMVKEGTVFFEPPVAYGCDGDCADCNCVDNEAEAMTDPLGPDPAMDWCSETYYIWGADAKCELPAGHDGDHENWATASQNGTSPLQWSGKVAPEHAT